MKDIRALILEIFGGLKVKASTDVSFLEISCNASSTIVIASLKTIKVFLKCPGPAVAWHMSFDATITRIRSARTSKIFYRWCFWNILNQRKSVFESEESFELTRRSSFWGVTRASGRWTETRRRVGVSDCSEVCKTPRVKRVLYHSTACTKIRRCFDYRCLVIANPSRPSWLSLNARTTFRVFLNASGWSTLIFVFQTLDSSIETQPSSKAETIVKSSPAVSM